jgi:hypothetical protein
MDPRGHEKNSFRNIVVVLRVLDKLKWNIELIPLCLSSRDSQKDQNTKNCIPKKTEKAVPVFNFGLSIGQKAPSIRNYVAWSSEKYFFTQLSTQIH